MNTGPKTSILNRENLEVLEEYYDQYLNNPHSIPSEWIPLFQEIEKKSASVGTNGHSSSLSASKLSADAEGVDFAVKALNLIQAYRRHGHYAARIDPLGLAPTIRKELHPSRHGLSDADLEQSVTVNIAGKPETAPLSNHLEKMERTYCSTLGVEFFYIRNEERRNWLTERMEAGENQWKLSKNIKKMIFEKLMQAEEFERFIATRFPGKKRFSLEGAESLIPTLSAAVELAGGMNVEQMVIGMAHRGRLNVLTNIMGKDPAKIFAEFIENVDEDASAGDVKYHLGYSNDFETLSGKNVHLSLAFNPSHLEVINSVVMGSVRARQLRGNDSEGSRYLPVIIHGDAAFSGQGINYEAINMSHLPGYRVGGGLHIISNNQIGFTTEPTDARSTEYCTDLVKMLQVPVFHVNADDPEACYRAIQLCMEWRQKYQTDVFIDIVGYRRLGHNETDEPAFTQPVMYKKIKGHPSALKQYEQKLLDEGIPQQELEAIRLKVRGKLEEAYKRLQEENLKIDVQTLSGDWTGFRRLDPSSHPETGVEESKIKELTEKLTTTPENFTINNKIKRLFDQRRAMIFEADGKLDWGMAESLAYATLLAEKTPVRISGQDSKRGTFSHRHAAIYDAEKGTEYIPLQNIHSEQGNFEIINSLLSEVAVLGFEFGYSLADPRTLVIWEAQFGDFVNGAQVIIDQFISSCEAKWNRMSGLVLLLPHGYEGQGPEHSSARLERFLQLCSQENIQVVNCTTPAQIFHLLRRQMKRNYRKPLVVLSPKSLLRHPAATSSFSEITSGKFQEIIDEQNPAVKPENTKRLILCSGRIYYDLLERRDKDERFDTAIIRVEQLYPVAEDIIVKIGEKYNVANTIFWAQDEPRNQGAWIFMEYWLERLLKGSRVIEYAGRAPSPSPATGYYKVHVQEQEKILEQLFGPK